MENKSNVTMRNFLKLKKTTISFEGSGALVYRINPLTTPRKFFMVMPHSIESDDILPGLYEVKDDSLTLLIISHGKNGKYPQPVKLANHPDGNLYKCARIK